MTPLLAMNSPSGRIFPLVLIYIGPWNPSSMFEHTESERKYRRRQHLIGEREPHPARAPL